MYIPGFSTNGLLMMHDGIRKALADDDSIPDGKDKTYGVREFSDWKQLSDAIEKELAKRRVTFESVPW